MIKVCLLVAQREKLRIEIGSITINHMISIHKGDWINHHILGIHLSLEVERIVWYLRTGRDTIADIYCSGADDESRDYIHKLIMESINGNDDASTMENT
jgi:hypothetical protein